MRTEHIAPNTSTKKAWKQPELILISHNDVLTKLNSKVHEGTGKHVKTNGYSYFSNQAGTSRVVLTKHSNPLGSTKSAYS